MAIWNINGGESLDDFSGTIAGYTNGVPPPASFCGLRQGILLNTLTSHHLLADLEGIPRDDVWFRLWHGRNNQFTDAARPFAILFDGANERVRFYYKLVAGVGTCVQARLFDGNVETTLFTCTLPHYSQTATSSSAATNLGYLTINVNAGANGWIRVYRDADLAGSFEGDVTPGGLSAFSSLKIQNPSTSGSWGETYLWDILVGDEDLRGVRMAGYTPNAAGDVNTFSTPGTFASLDETGIGADFIEANAAGQKYLVNLTATPAAMTTLGCRGLYVRSINEAPDAIAPTKLRQLIKTNGAEYQGAQKAPPLVQNGRPERDFFAVNPNTGLSWTIAQLDALQIGAIAEA